MRTRTDLWTDVGLGVLAGLIAVAVGVWGLGVTWGDLAVPWGEGDMLTVYALAENVGRGNWFLVNPDLGYPGFQDLGHYPIPDIASIAQIALLAKVSSSPIAAVNAFVLGTFFTVAAAFYLAARVERVSRAISIVLAVVFSVLPWHFVRATGHVFLASYMSVPLAIVLISVVARRRLDRAPGVGFLLLTAGAAVVVGANGIYYALMTALLLVAVLALTSARSGPPGWRTFGVAALVPLTTAASVAVSRVSISTPSLGETVVRSPSEAYLYGGNIATLFSPARESATGQWLDGFLDLSFPNNGTFEGEAMLSAAGVVAVLITCWMAAYRWTSREALVGGTATARATFWPGLFVLVVAFFAVGGFGALFSYWVSADIRAWGRFSIFAAGMAFLVAGLVLTALVSSSRRPVRITARVLVGIMGLFAVVDLSSARFAPNLELYRDRDQELREFVSAVEGRTSAGCPILELPLVEFPEVPPVNGMVDYSHLWSYLYSSDLRWSYGAVKGTSQGGWGLEVKDDSAVLLDEAKAAGFCGMQFDTSALANRAELVDELAVFGLPDLMSSSGRWLYFDLSGLDPGEYVVDPGSGFSVATADSTDPSVLWWMVEGDASITVRGAPSTSVDVILDLVSPPCGPARIEVAGVEVGVDGSQAVEHRVVLDAQGVAVIEVSALSPVCSEDVQQPTFVGLEGPSLPERTT